MVDQRVDHEHRDLIGRRGEEEREGRLACHAFALREREAVLRPGGEHENAEHAQQEHRVHAGVQGQVVPDNEQPRGVCARNGADQHEQERERARRAAFLFYRKDGGSKGEQQKDEAAEDRGEVKRKADLTP